MELRCVFFFFGWNFQEKYTAASTAQLSSETHLPYMYFTLHTPPHPPGSRFVTYLDLPSKTNSKGPPKPSSKNLRFFHRVDMLTVESFSWSPGLVVFPLAGRVMCFFFLFFFGEGDESRNVRSHVVYLILWTDFFKHLQAAKVWTTKVDPPKMQVFMLTPFCLDFPGIFVWPKDNFPSSQKMVPRIPSNHSCKSAKGQFITQKHTRIIGSNKLFAQGKKNTRTNLSNLLLQNKYFQW